MRKEGKAKVLTEQEFERLLLIAGNGQFATRNLALIYCSFGLGLRAKEIAALKISDIADDNYTLREEILLTRSMTKGEKSRTVYPVNPKVAKALQNHLDTLKAIPQKYCVFTSLYKRAFSANSLQKWFSALYDKAGIKGATSHSGRRTYITNLIEKGIDIKAVSRLSGHSSIATTAIYVEDNPERLKRISAEGVF